MNYSLDKLMKQVRGVSYSKNDASLTYKEGFVPVLRAGNIQNSRIIHDDFVYIPKEGVKNVQLLKKGDVLIAASSGSISIVGKAAMILQDMNAGFGAFCKVLRPNKEIVNEDYFKFYFETPHYKNTIRQLAEGANINNLKTEHFDNLEIYLPPLPQQQKIANILDAADALRQNDKALIAKYDELTQALFLDMFGDPVSNPKGWEKVKLGAVTNMKAGKFIAASDIFSENNYDMYSCYGGNGLRGFVKTYTHEGEFVLIGRQGALCGNVKITNGKFHATEHAIVCSPIMKYQTLWLYYLLKMLNLNRFSTGAAQPGLNVGTLADLEIMMVPYDLQKKFAERVEVIEEQKSIAQKSLEKSESLFNSLLQKAFKGELV